MRIIFRPPEGGKKNDLELDINADELIESVRQRVQKKTTDYEVHKLTYKGSNLKDDRTLRSYDVPEGATIIIQAQFHGQYLPLGVQPGMERKRAAESEVPAELAPDAKRLAMAAAQKDLSEAEVPWVAARCATAGDKGMRRQMEDEHLICTSLRDQCPGLSQERDFALFAIFDGHGGKQVAGFVKTYLAVELANAFAAEEGDRDKALSDKVLKKAIEATFQRLDSRIATELPGVYDGSTAVVLLVNTEMIFCVNLGDSAAYLCRIAEDGDMQPIPLQRTAHKCWMMKEKERILRAGGAVENGRINGVLEVSRSFGDISLKKYGVLCTPEYMKFRVDAEKDKFILLGCDGFWSNWTAAEALAHAQDVVQMERERAERDEEPMDLKECCRELVRHVIEEKKSQDNVSVMLLELAAAPAKGEGGE